MKLVILSHSAPLQWKNIGKVAKWLTQISLWIKNNFLILGEYITKNQKCYVDLKSSFSISWRVHHPEKVAKKVAKWLTQISFWTKNIFQSWGEVHHPKSKCHIELKSNFSIPGGIVGVHHPEPKCHVDLKSNFSIPAGLWGFITQNQNVMLT